jgi:HAD superfamily hydrolase (TIGR01509 family)
VLVIFDCDGVLVDSEPLSNAALAEALKGVGLDYSVERTTAEFKGRSWASCEARIAELLGRPAPAALQRDYEARRDAAFARALRPVPGIEAALDALDGTPTCVASSGTHAKMRLTLGLTGLLERFEGRIFSATDVADGKPAPDLFLHAAAAMGFAPADSVVVEDSEVGVAAARAAGMRVLGFGVSGGDAVFGDMAELPGLLGHRLGDQ